MTLNDFYAISTDFIAIYEGQQQILQNSEAAFALDTSQPIASCGFAAS